MQDEYYKTQFEGDEEDEELDIQEDNEELTYGEDHFENNSDQQANPRINIDEEGSVPDMRRSKEIPSNQVQQIRNF